MPMAGASHLRHRAEKALRLAQDSTDQVLVKRLLADAAESLGRADAIDAVEGLKEVAAELTDETTRQAKRSAIRDSHTRH